MITRTFDILEQYRTKYRLDDALVGKVAGKWVKYSGDSYLQHANEVSCGLWALGYRKGDKIAMISNNRPEWNFFEMGMAQIGVISVPIHPAISLDEYQYILNHAAPRMLIVSDKLLLERLRPLFENSPTIEHIYSFNLIEGVNNWKEIARQGNNTGELTAQVQQIKNSIKPDDPATLIYTSGTTGAPKGVMLSHNNLVSNIKAICNRNYLTVGARALSSLPISHICERIINYHLQNLGIAIYYIESVGTILENIREVQPHILNTVPRLLDRIYLGIVGKRKELKGIKRRIMNNAIEVALNFDPRRKPTIGYRLRLMLARRLIFPKWAAQLGGQVRIIVSWGSPLQTPLINLFNAIGIDLIEGYGLTETAAVIAMSDLRCGRPKPGTVGTVLDGLDVQIANDGEICCKGPNVMLGYYKNPELTAQVIDSNGYFHTGDVGTFDKNNFLRFTDRKNEIFKLSNGKDVAPQVIENKLKDSPLIDRAIVIGANEKFAGALISPNFTQLHNWCYTQEIKFSDNKNLIQIPDVIEYYQQIVHRVNRQTGSAEQLKRFRLVADEWNMQTGELSTTLKLKRRVLTEKYADIIREMYLDTAQ